MTYDKLSPFERIRALLPDRLFLGVDTTCLEKNCEEIRVRVNRTVRFTVSGRELKGGIIADEALCADVLEGLSEHSAFSMENELREGFFTARGGCRVGVCGRMYSENQSITRLWNISGFNIRIAREIKGCADGIVNAITAQHGLCLRGLLVLSPPGVGKTTLLRDAARQLSNLGSSVAVADERGELAACYLGVPTMDVGERTDVMDMCPKAEAVKRLVRSMNPNVIVTDEIGSQAEADALMDAMNCGVAALASAHAEDIEHAMLRPHIKRLIESGCFGYCATVKKHADGGRSVKVQAL